MHKGHVRNLSSMLRVLMWGSVGAFILMMGLYWAGFHLDKSTDFASKAATTVGFLLAAASLFVATSALQQSQRSTDLRVLDARQWLKKRQQVVAEIEYAMFASPTLLDNLRPSDPARISRRDAIKAAVSVVGAFRRLRDSLSGFASERGFLLTHAVMQERFKATRSSAFETYIDAYKSSVEYAPTAHLKRFYPWIFGGNEAVPSVRLSPQMMLHAYTAVMVELDYLDQRVPSLLGTLAEEDANAIGLAVFLNRNAGAALQKALVASAKDIYCHLAVMRAFLEVEWTVMFPEPVESWQLENRISGLLTAGDGTSFVGSSPSGSRSIDDNVAGYRYAHAIAHVNSVSVFEDDLNLNQPQATSDGEAPSRIQRLYAEWLGSEK
jgi:hypothetical protein